MRFGFGITGGLVLCGLFALAGCEESGATLYISGAVKPDDMECTVAPGNTRLLRGAYDVSSQSANYVIFPVFVNQIRARATALGADPNGIHVSEAEIELQATDGSAISFPGLPNPFTVTTAVFVPSATGTTPGQSVGSVELVPAVYRDALPASGTIIAVVKAFGETNGHVDVESSEFNFPIDLCENCLYGCVAGEEMPEVCCAPGVDCLSKVVCTP